MISLGTKAETLERLRAVIKKAKILPQLRFTAEQFCNDKKYTISELQKAGWLQSPLIVRSSAQTEDQAKQSYAGHFTSVLNVQGEKNILKAMEKVMSSFHGQNTQDQILLQPMLQNVEISGVVLSKNPTNAAPYILINYDDITGSTASVTSGNTNKLKAYCHYRYTEILPPAPLDKVILLLRELEALCNTDCLDIEFAIDQAGELFLLQARPLVIQRQAQISHFKHTKALQKIHRKIQQSFAPHPYLHGRQPIYGVMPDWNPAEIIGIRPKPLALSLYKEMITDYIWAYQRDNYGYLNLRSFPLLISFHGLPYIDVRVSFNSFIPKSLEAKIAEKLVNYYLDKLLESPNFHDKIEFEVIYSCYTLDLPQRLEPLKEYGFVKKELDSIAHHLRDLTNSIIDQDNGLWKTDTKKIEILEKKYSLITKSSLDPLAKIYWLLEDCKRYGTLPFAGLARAGFIAIQLLKSLIHVGVLNLEEYHHFLQSLDTVSSRMKCDLTQMSKRAFLKKYGHLRPGTYDILSFRYDEKPEQYFNWEKVEQTPFSKSSSFLLSFDQMKKIENLLKSHGLNHNIISFFDFIKAAIEGREYAKFIFSRSLSYVLTLVKQLGEKHGFSPEKCAFTDISLFKKLFSSSEDIKTALKKTIEEKEHSYTFTQQLNLPPLISSPQQIFSYALPSFEPNYITLKTARGAIARPTDEKSTLSHAILFILSADPGYDWIFSHKIAGFVTMYGGMNSHMAIRAAELDIPAVIGAGEVLYQKWEKAKILEMDCANRQVRILS